MGATAYLAGCSIPGAWPTFCGPLSADLGLRASATPTNGAASAVIEVGDTQVGGPISLNVGTNLIDVVASAQNGDQQTYSLTVTRALALVWTPALTLRLSGLKTHVLKLGKRVTVKGTATPASLAGNKVKLTVQRKQHGKWRTLTRKARTLSRRGAYSLK